MQKLWRNDGALQLAVLAFMLVLYRVLLTMQPRSYYLMDVTFNSMASHLVHGQFDVDPSIITFEGFARNGHVYSYWGIFCALLRLPLILFHRNSHDITAWSVLAASCLSGFMLVRTILFLRRQVRQSPASDLACGLMILYVIFGGPQLDFLVNNIYQEVASWAAAFGMVFVYFAVKGLITRNFSTGTLLGLASSAGLAVLTRVVTGMGLCIAFGLLLLCIIMQDGRVGLLSRIFSKRVLLPCGILAVMLIFAGIVNYGRWGNPLTFADHRLYIGNQYFPDRFDRLQHYGYFNIRRVPLGLLYFFFPIWAFHAPSGELFFQSTQLRLFDSIELPPSSFFLTDLVAFVFIGMLVPAVKDRAKFLSARVVQALAISLGIGVPCLLLLTSYNMAHRYRMDFYPEIEFLALLGLYATLTSPALSQRLIRWRSWLIAGLVISVTTSFAVYLLYELSLLGPSGLWLRKGVLYYYVTQAHYARLHHERLLAF
jgi:hypothetical protein